MRKPKQLQLTLPTWGGKRRGAGRRPTGRRAGVPHRRRDVDASSPLHVTLRVRPDVPHLRRRSAWKALRSCFAAAADRLGFRLNHFSIQGNHLHLIVEADDALALARGMKGLSVRIARGLNRVTGRRGRVLADRYHSRPLRTPREVRNALAYVLGNARVHAERRGGTAAARIDSFSSAPWFDGWRRPPAWRMTSPPPTAEPTTWLLRIGWRRLGSL